MRNVNRSFVRGFTLTELMTTMAVLLMVMTAVARVFDTVQRGVKTGIAVAEVSTTQRMIAKEMQRDFDAMLPPMSGGFMSIATGHFANRYVTPEHMAANVRFSSIKHDQIMFIRTRGDLDPVCPNVLTPTVTYAPAYNVLAPNVRVWYGHVTKTNPDGTDAGDLDLGATPLPAGQTPGPNYLAYNWVLGRQALFLVDNVTSTNVNGQVQVTARSAKVAGQVNRLTGANAPPMPAVLKNGYVDVAQQSLQQINTELATTPANITTYMFYAAADRLRANPRPLFSPNATNPADRRFMTTWQIAQMHPVFAENVSDFIVEFAGDYYNNGTTVAGHDGMLDVYNTDDGIKYPDVGSTKMRDLGKYKGSIRWYGGEEDRVWSNTPPPGNKDPSRPANATAKGYYMAGGNPRIYYFAANKPEYWPYLVRIRYRLHDHRAQMSNPDDLSQGTTATVYKTGQMYEMIFRVRR